MNYIILLRHGQSHWNQENKFTGLTDIPLNKKGAEEANSAGKRIKELNIPIELFYTSKLKRAIDTAVIAVKYLNKDNYDLIQDACLNERDYGELVGLNKSETKQKFGEEQVHIWRRSYDIPPPGGESLKKVVERVKVFYDKYLSKDINENKNILITAHGNSLRALCICLGIYQPQEISKIEIPTGVPFVIKFDNNKIISYKFY